jgi:26S proteasome regulatory subunit N10
VACRLDTSSHMRNGDYEPTRLEAQYQAARLLMDVKLSMGAMDTVGFVSTGPSVTTRASVTKELELLAASIRGLVPKGAADFVPAIKVASLALHNRAVKEGSARIVAFVGSPVTATPEELKQLAKEVRKMSIGIDVVLLGEQASSQAKLEGFLEAMNHKRDNCHLVTVPPGANLTDMLLSSVVVTGVEGGGAAAAAASGGAGGHGAMDEDEMMQAAMRESLAMAQAHAGEGDGPGAVGTGGATHGLPDDINVALLEANGIDLSQDIELLRVIQDSLVEAFGLQAPAPAPASAPPSGGTAAAAEVPSPSAEASGTAAPADAENLAAIMAEFPGLDLSDPEIAATMASLMAAEQQYQQQHPKDEDKDSPDAKRPKRDDGDGGPPPPSSSS